VVYKRVLPRDAFNEAKFLKGLARLTMLIEDGNCPLVYVFDQTWETRIEYGNWEGLAGFIIDQRPEDGGLECENLFFYYKRKMYRDTELRIYSMLNCQSPYNIVCAGSDGGELIVFEDDGTFTDEFKTEIGMV